MKNSPIKSLKLADSFGETVPPKLPCKVSNVACVALGGVCVLTAGYFWLHGRRVLSSTYTTAGEGLAVLGGVLIVCGIISCYNEYVYEDPEYHPI